MGRQPSLMTVMPGLACCAVLLCAAGVLAQNPVPSDQAAARTERIKQLRHEAAKIRRELKALKQTEAKKKLAEGLTRSSVTREEFTEQPTRNMRESLESLPGTAVRQGSGARDTNVSIRGSGH
jgi:outer membrane receptor for Fe3+-dicitrate